jgi:DNA-binding transcriptional LysR family regulator
MAPGTAVRRFTDQVFHELNFIPHSIMELSSSEEVKRVVELNLGVGIISKMSIANELRMGTLKMIRVNELERSHPIGIMYKSGRYLSSAMQQFLNDLKGMPHTQFLGSE